LTIYADNEHQQINRNSPSLLYTLDTITALLAVGLAPLLLPPDYSDPAV